MPAALLMRGYSYTTIGQVRAWGVDWRKSIESHRRYLIEPLKEKYGRVDVFLASYNTPYINDIEKDYDSIASGWFNTGTQKSTALAGLDMVSARGHYDTVVMCRFDIELKQCPLQLPNYDPEKCNFLWREWNQESWDNHRRVPDAIHILSGHYLRGFSKGIHATPSDTCLHLIYHPVARNIGEENINILLREGFIDSNTDVMANPVYNMIRIRG